MKSPHSDAFCAKFYGNGLLLLGAFLLIGATNLPYCGSDVFASASRALSGARRVNCRVYRVRAPKAVLRLAVAANQSDRVRGLMSVRALPSHTGMIFTFPDESVRVFWMKDTLIPLDMIFIKADGAVSTVARNVPATTLSTPDEQIPRRFGMARYVIELNAGEALRAGIAPGMHLNLPELGAT